MIFYTTDLMSYLFGGSYLRHQINFGIYDGGGWMREWADAGIYPEQKKSYFRQLASAVAPSKTCMVDRRDGAGSTHWPRHEAGFFFLDVPPRWYERLFPRTAIGSLGIHLVAELKQGSRLK